MQKMYKNKPAAGARRRLKKGEIRFTYFPLLKSDAFCILNFRANLLRTLL